jgi:hypothetical protein
MIRRGEEYGEDNEMEEVELDSRAEKRLTLMLRRFVSGAIWLAITISLLDTLRVDRRATIVFWPFLWLRWEGYIWFPTDGPELVQRRRRYPPIRTVSTVTRV